MKTQSDHLNILLVEDNEGDVVLFECVLEDCGFKHMLNVLNDGESAWTHLSRLNTADKTSYPDIIFLDINLPCINGIDLLKKIKAYKDTHDIPVAVLSSSKAAHEVDECQRYGALDNLVKPVTDDELRRVLSDVKLL